MSPFKTLDEALRAAGQSTTAPRRAVFAALQDQEPITMHELVECCGGTDRASVYRSVALFERLGIIQRLQTGWKYKLELTGEYHTHHHHAHCLACGKSLVLPKDETLERSLERAAKRLGFLLERHQLELQGRCADCQRG